MPERCSLDERRLLERAARIALRGHGYAEPNPMVGCLVVDDNGNVLAEAYHARFGEAHAERIALERAGATAQGGTLLTTLEPCTHHGQTPPCTEAILEAGITRVLFGTADPNPQASGGAELLRKRGLGVEHCPTHATDLLNAPHVHRIRTGLPWVVAKWAQTIDGRIATARGDSRWISSARSRRLVHRERGRVDAVMTGIGTVLADDPMLSPRDVRSPRRMPERVVVDAALQIPLDSVLVTTAREIPTIVLCVPEVFEGKRAGELRKRGVILASLGNDSEIRDALRELAAARGYATVLVEAGGGLLGRLFREHLVNDTLVFIAPKVLGDQAAPGSVRGCAPERIADGIKLEPIVAFPRNDDVIAWYRVAADTA